MARLVRALRSTFETADRVWLSLDAALDAHALAHMIVGIGIDAVDIHRVERMFADWGDRMLKRLFSPSELAYLATKGVPAQHIAVRLAAKEATYKALSGNELARGIGWRDTEVVTRSDGAPELRLSRARRGSGSRSSGRRAIHVSLTHSDATAVAVVIVER